MNRKVFFDNLIDEFGIHHHTDGHKWLRSTGYSLDDAARGLLLCLITGRQDQAQILLSYIEQSLKNGDFYGFATAAQEFNTYPSSEDAKGQVVWALGYALSTGFETPRCQAILDQITASLTKMQHIRGYAYALLGTVYFDQPLSDRLAKKIEKFCQNLSPKWYWPEPQLTYANGIIPYALLRYRLRVDDPAAGYQAKKLLEFIQNASYQNRVLGPIGNAGWFSRGQNSPADYSQQPVDSAYMVLAWLAYDELFGSIAGRHNAQQWLQWFEGQNIAHKKMYQTSDLKAFDGIDPNGINRHSGAESNICFLLAKWAYQKKQTF